MRRFVLSSSPDLSGRVVLEGKDARYLSRVLRLRRGDSFRALLPDGAEALFVVGASSAGRLEATLAEPADTERARSDRIGDERRSASVPALPRFVLLQALPKGQKMDLIVRQATEAGISLVVPVIAERSVAHVDPGREGSARRERWERIVKEALQQSGSSIGTRVAEPMDLPSALDLWAAEAPSGSVAVFLHQDPLAQGSAHGYLSQGPETVCIAVGPEGGFSPGEVDSFLRRGFLPLLLGPNVLRTETAALYATAALQVVLLERASWNPVP